MKTKRESYRITSAENFFKQEFVSPIIGILPVLLDDQNRPWFPVERLAKALDVNENVARNADRDDKIFVKDGGGHAKTWVSEACMYMMIFKSHKPEAKAFQRWVTDEVLPSIRKHGGYILGQEHLASADHKILVRKIEALSAEVDRAKSGKAKLTNYLREEEDRVFSLRDKLNQLESELSGIEEVLMAVAPEIALYRLKKRQQERCTSMRTAKQKAAVTSEVFDPLVLDLDGFVCRLSELLARDTHR